MNIRCRLHGHDFRTVSIHVGMTVGDRETVAVVTRSCDRCGEYEIETLHNCWIAIDIVPGKPPSDDEGDVRPEFAERLQRQAQRVKAGDKGTPLCEACGDGDGDCWPVRGCA